MNTPDLLHLRATSHGTCHMYARFNVPTRGDFLYSTNVSTPEDWSPFGPSCPSCASIFLSCGISVVCILHFWKSLAQEDPVSSEVSIYSSEQVRLSFVYLLTTCHSSFICATSGSKLGGGCYRSWSWVRMNAFENEESTRSCLYYWLFRSELGSLFKSKI